MVAQQLSYTQAPAIGFPGMKADSGPSDCPTYGNGEASAEIPPGCFVALGTGDVKAILPASSGAVIVGCVVHSDEYARDVEFGSTGIKPNMPMAVMQKGRICVRVEEAVNKGDQVYVRYATGSGGSQKGAVRKSADTSTAVAVTGCYFHTSAAAGGIAAVQLTLSI